MFNQILKLVQKLISIPSTQNNRQALQEVFSVTLANEKNLRPIRKNYVVVKKQKVFH